MVGVQLGSWATSVGEGWPLDTPAMNCKKIHQAGRIFPNFRSLLQGLLNDDFENFRTAPSFLDISSLEISHQLAHHGR